MEQYQQKEQKTTNYDDLMWKKYAAVAQNADSTIDLNIELTSEIDGNLVIADKTIDESINIDKPGQNQPEDQEHQDEEEEDEERDILDPVNYDVMINSFRELRNSMLGKH